MTSNELKELVKKHFSLVEADAVSEEIINEEITEEFAEETTEEVVEEVFGEIADINDAFIVKFPGDSLQVGDKVVVVTKEGQEMDAPNGTHELKDGTKIVTEDSVVKEIIGADDEKALKAEEMAEAEEVVENVVEEVIEEIKDEMMEEEAAPSLEEIVKEISDAVKEEMGKMKEKMAELEEKVAGISDAPAAAPVMKQGPETDFSSKKAKFAAFDVSKAKNADRIAMAIKQFKNKK